MNQNKLLLYGAILVLVSFTASCVEQPLQEGIVCNKNINTDHVSEYTRVQEQSGLIYCIAVYDGDTITIKTGGKVRLIGVDAPELSEPGGDIARNFLACLVLNREVHLEKGDVNTDSYNRLLRYVYVNGVCVNEEMIKNGYAEARYIPEKNREKYIQLEIKAETRKLALWKCTVFQPRLIEWGDDIPVIDWKNAGTYLNQYVIVTGTIVDTYTSGGVCFLNFHTDENACFTVVIFACDIPGFLESPDVYYRGKTVSIIGIIQEYKGIPEIIVKTPAQIRIDN